MSDECLVNECKLHRAYEYNKLLIELFIKRFKNIKIHLKVLQ